MNNLTIKLQGLIVALLTLVLIPQSFFAQCSLTCNASGQVSLDINCFAEVEPDDILEGTSNCVGPLTVSLFDSGGNPIPTSPFLNELYVGQTITARVTDGATGNYCESPLDVRDYLAPQITCANLILPCLSSTDPDVIGYPVVIDNCDDEPQLVYEDVENDLTCDPDAVSIITRTWTATDVSGNSTSCQQTITLERSDIVDVVFPENRDDIDEPSLDCVNPDLSPDLTGYPELDGFELQDGTVCELWVMYSDSDPLPQCENSFTIIRTWTVTDECSSQSVSDTQIIKVTDQQGPTINCPDDFTVSTNSNQCAALVDLPEATASDNCSSVSNINFSVNDEAGFNVATDNPIYLEVGVHTFTYTATDDCGNNTTCELKVTVDDGVNPVVVCNSFTTIALGSGGTTLIPAITFDDGSYDNCGPISYLARRMDNINCPGDDATVFDETVPFYCCEVGDTVLVEMMVEDAINRLSNSCMVSVIVQEQLNPEIICAPDITLECDTDDLSPDVTGFPDASDNCGVADLIFEDSFDLDDCNVGMIFRTWTVIDSQGLSAVCLQKITLEDNVDPVIDFPENIDDGECGDADDVTITGEPEVEDACGLFGIGNEDIVFYLDEGCTRKILRTWTVYDWCNDTSYTDLQVIKEFDNSPPVFENTPSDITVECDAIPAAMILTATDVCSGTSIDVEAIEETIPGDCPENFIINRKWIAEDNCGNRDSVSQMITVDDTTPPVISGDAPNLTLECDEAIPDPLLTVSDNCDLDVTLEMTEDIMPGICADAFTIARTWTATDNCGNQSLVMQTIEVEDNTSPEFQSTPPDLTVACDMIPPAVDVIATDNCDSEVDIAFIEEVSSNTCFGELLIIRTWTATDNCGNANSISQSITTVDDEAPVINGVPDDVTVDCGMIPDIPTVVVIDNCDFFPDVDFEENIVTGACAEDIIVTRTWTATDDCGNQTVEVQVITSMDDEAPVLSETPIDMTVTCGMVPTAPVLTATDNCDPDVDVVFNENTTTGACAEDVVVTRMWTATDNCGNETSVTQVITSMDDEAPVLSETPIDMTVTCGMVPTAPVLTATDNCDPDVDVVFDENTTTGACAEDVVVTRMWTATDNCGNETSVIQVITSMDDEAPVLSATPIDLTVTCGMVPTAPVLTATDNCDPDVDVVFDENTMLGACLEDVVVTRMWTATDNCGNETSVTQVITSMDDEAPVLSAVPDDMTVQCDAIPDPPTVTATDNCVGQVDVVFAETMPQQNCEDEFILVWTWTATDNCGNESSVSTTIEVIDDTAPVLMGVPQNITIECTDIPEPAMPTAIDNCDDMPEITFEEFFTDPDCGSGNYQLFRTWTASDNCQNQSIRTQIITLFDESAPVFTNTPDDITVACDSIPLPDDLMAQDACNNGVSFLVMDNQMPGACANNFTIDRTWTVTDSCGNEDTFTQQITVEDNEAPFIQCPNDITFDIMFVGVCEFQYGMLPTIFDNCDPNVAVDYSIDFGNDGMIDSVGMLPGFPFLLIAFPIGENTITFNATDDCGNTNSCSTSVEVNDLVPPAFFCNPQTVVLSSVDSTGLAVPSAFLLDPFLECELDTLLIEDIDNPGQLLDTLFLDYEDALTSQANNGIDVQIFAIDESGNPSSCMTKIFVIPPMSPPGYGFISGDIYTEEDAAVSNIEVSLDGGMSDMQMTDEEGAFMFELTPEGQGYYIEPFHNEDHMNGISTWDLVLLQQHILGVSTLTSPYKMIAADVNRSGNISSIDIVELRKLILGITPVFQYNTSWRFVDANFVFPNTENPFESEFPEFCIISNLENGAVDMDFVGVKVGDLNSSVDTNFEDEVEDRNRDDFNFYTTNQYISEGETIHVPIYAKDFNEVLGFQFTLAFDPDVLQFEVVENGDLLDFDSKNIGLQFLEEGWLTCSWGTIYGQSLSEDDLLFDLVFKAKNTARLDEVVQVNSDFTNAELYMNQGEIHNLQLLFEEEVLSSKQFKLYQNRPNPFTDETIIAFDLAKASPLVLTIYDAAGRIVFEKSQAYDAGYHEILINAEDLNYPGVYFCRVKTETDLAIQKIIFEK